MIFAIFAVGGFLLFTHGILNVNLLTMMLGLAVMAVSAAIDDEGWYSEDMEIGNDKA